MWFPGHIIICASMDRKKNLQRIGLSLLCSSYVSHRIVDYSASMEDQYFFSHKFRSKLEFSWQKWWTPQYTVLLPSIVVRRNHQFRKSVTKGHVNFAWNHSLRTNLLYSLICASCWTHTIIRKIVTSMLIQMASEWLAKSNIACQFLKSRFKSNVYIFTACNCWWNCTPSRYFPWSPGAQSERCAPQNDLHFYTIEHCKSILTPTYTWGNWAGKFSNLFTIFIPVRFPRLLYMLYLNSLSLSLLGFQEPKRNGLQ